MIKYPQMQYTQMPKPISNVLKVVAVILVLPGILLPVFLAFAVPLSLIFY